MDTGCKIKMERQASCLVWMRFFSRSPPLHWPPTVITSAYGPVSIYPSSQDPMKTSQINFHKIWIPDSLEVTRRGMLHVIIQGVGRGYFYILRTVHPPCLSLHLKMLQMMVTMMVTPRMVMARVVDTVMIIISPSFVTKPRMHAGLGLHWSPPEHLWLMLQALSDALYISWILTWHERTFETRSCGPYLLPLLLSIIWVARTTSELCCAIRGFRPKNTRFRPVLQTP